MLTIQKINEDGKPRTMVKDKNGVRKIKKQNANTILKAISVELTPTEFKSDEKEITEQIAEMTRETDEKKLLHWQLKTKPEKVSEFLRNKYSEGQFNIAYENNYDNSEARKKSGLIFEYRVFLRSNPDNDSKRSAVKYVVSPEVIDKYGDSYFYHIPIYKDDDQRFFTDDNEEITPEGKSKKRDGFLFALQELVEAKRKGSFAISNQSYTYLADRGMMKEDGTINLEIQGVLVEKYLKGLSPQHSHASKEYIENMFIDRVDIRIESEDSKEEDKKEEEKKEEEKGEEEKGEEEPRSFQTPRKKAGKKSMTGRKHKTPKQDKAVLEEARRKKEEEEEEARKKKEEEEEEKKKKEEEEEKRKKEEEEEKKKEEEEAAKKENDEKKKKEKEKQKKKDDEVETENAIKWEEQLPITPGFVYDDKLPFWQNMINAVTDVEFIISQPESGSPTLYHKAIPFVQNGKLYGLLLRAGGVKIYSKEKMAAISDQLKQKITGNLEKGYIIGPAKDEVPVGALVKYGLDSILTDKPRRKGTLTWLDPNLRTTKEITKKILEYK